MKASVRVIGDLELALLRRGVHDRVADLKRCRRCHRTPLIGEKVYFYEREIMLCELCRALERDEPVSSGIVHGPAFGHTMRITDRRAA
jgi:hypothetical protein